jgi:demethylmenaquinone methyltransferase/2-methoxy-6-polyprenyl-1,4-benzoquinol methylase
MSNASIAAPIQPHPELRTYYGPASGKREFLREIFDATAGDYDRVERILALGSGRWYRRQALRRAGLSRGMHVLDVATGTGLVAREAIEIVGDDRFVVGIDPSIGMISQARSLDRLLPVLGVGESLPFDDGHFDFISMGYALRHLPDLRQAFAEYHRVLKPGGRACIMEISRPEGRLKNRLLGAYFQLVLPTLARLVEASRDTHRLWQYYWETIDQCVAPEIVLNAMRDVGFVDVKRNVSLGIFSEYVGAKCNESRVMRNA